MAKTKKTRRAGGKAGARKAGRTSSRRAAKRAQPSRKATRRPARKTTRAAARKAKKAARPSATVKKARPSTSVKKAARPLAPKTSKKPAVAKAARPQAAGPRSAAAKPATRRRAPTLDRERRRVNEPEMVPTPPSSLDLDRSASAARSGRAELKDKLHKLTSTGPALTGGDLDADWESAESVGDEAPGGDNPTPDQDVVDEIGKALGVEYEDDEELQGGDEILERDRNRWELDPASRDDFDEE